MGKMIIGTILLILAAVRGDIHSSKEYTANSVLGVLAGITPFIFDAMTGLTEMFKMFAAICAFGVAAVSFYRAWKYKDKK